MANTIRENIQSWRRIWSSGMNAAPGSEERRKADYALDHLKKYEEFFAVLLKHPEKYGEHAAERWLTMSFDDGVQALSQREKHPAFQAASKPAAGAATTPAPRNMKEHLASPNTSLGEYLNLTAYYGHLLAEGGNRAQEWLDRTDIKKAGEEAGEWHRQQAQTQARELKLTAALSQASQSAGGQTVKEYLESLAQGSPEHTLLTKYKEHLLHEVPRGKERAEQWLNWRDIKGAVQQAKQWHEEQLQQAQGLAELAKAAGIAPSGATPTPQTPATAGASPQPTAVPPSQPQTATTLPVPRSIAEALQKVPSEVTVGQRLEEIEPYLKSNTAAWAAVERVNTATEYLLKTPEYEKARTALEALPAGMLRDFTRLEAGTAKEAMRPKVEELIHALAAAEHPANTPGVQAKVKAAEQTLWKKMGTAEQAMQELGKTPAYQELIHARRNPALGALGKEYLILDNVMDRETPLEKAFSSSQRPVLEQQYGYAIDAETADRIDKAAQEQRGQLYPPVQQSTKKRAAPNQRLGAIGLRLGEMQKELEAVDLNGISKELEQLNRQIATEREEIRAALSGNVSAGALGTVSPPGAAHRPGFPPQKNSR